jgi:hypothetical protein
MRLDENEKRTEVNGGGLAAGRLYLADVRTLHPELHVAAIQTGIQPQHKKEPRLMRRRGSLFPFEDMKTD